MGESGKAESILAEPSRELNLNQLLSLFIAAD